MWWADAWRINKRTTQQSATLTVWGDDGKDKAGDGSHVKCECPQRDFYGEADQDRQRNARRVLLCIRVFLYTLGNYEHE